MKRCAVLWLAACMLRAACACADDGLGRLFTTPGDRARLDAARETAAPTTTTQEMPATASVSFEGLILRRGEPVRAWVNGQGAPPEDWQTRTGDAAHVQQQGLWLRHSGKRLKAGQTGISHAR